MPDAHLPFAMAFCRPFSDEECGNAAYHPSVFNMSEHVAVLSGADGFEKHFASMTPLRIKTADLRSKIGPVDAPLFNLVSCESTEVE